MHTGLNRVGGVSQTGRENGVRRTAADTFEFEPSVDIAGCQRNAGVRALEGSLSYIPRRQAQGARPR
ncbi:MAG: hypothetical protein ABL886_10860, partial [Rhodoglobus sp.]